MFRENAGKVKMDFEGIVKREYSFEIVDEWCDAMKAALNKDIELLDCGDERKALEFKWHYELACEILIRDLVFQLKWARISLKRLHDENKG